MTDLASNALRSHRNPAHRHKEKGLDMADRLGIAIAIVAAIVALALAVHEIAGSPTALPSLIPFDQPALLSNFTA